VAACCMATTTPFAPVTGSMAPPSDEDVASARSRSTSAGGPGWASNERALAHFVFAEVRRDSFEYERLADLEEAIP